MATPCGQTASFPFVRPEVSIVTPCLNTAPFLEETIRSVVEQQGVAFEYFIQDGGSTDGSVEIIQRLASRVSGWVSAPDGGQSEALNQGFARASGGVLGWLNADDRYEEGALAHAVEMLAGNPGAVAVAGAVRLEHPDGTSTVRRAGDVTRAGLLNWRRNWIGQPGVFFRREAWEQAGPLDIGLELAMDFDLWCRLLRVGPFVTTERVVATYRLRPEAKCFRQPQRMREETLAVMLRYADEGALRELLCDGERERWRVEDAAARLVVEHVRRRWAELEGEIVLYGAGAHTPWLLGVTEGLGRARVSVIVDDGAEPGQTMGGLAVRRPEDVTFLPETVVLSTDVHGRELARRARETFGKSVRVVDLYAGLGPGPFPKHPRDQGHWGREGSGIRGERPVRVAEPVHTA